jgi:hypothetical protein
LDGVMNVLSPRYEFEVCDVVVGLVAVPVIDFFASLNHSDERVENEAMDKE